MASTTDAILRNFILKNGAPSRRTPIERMEYAKGKGRRKAFCLFCKREENGSNKVFRRPLNHTHSMTVFIEWWPDHPHGPPECYMNPGPFLSGRGELCSLDNNHA